MVDSRRDKRKGMGIAGHIVGHIFMCLFFVIISDRGVYAAEIPSSEFEDIDLYNYLLENYDTDGDGMLETEEAEAVNSISMYYTAPEYTVTENISSFKGLEYFSNLYSFGITYDSETELLDISALSSMTQLTGLTIEGHKNIKDFTALYNLVNLSYLDLTRTNVADIGFVANMPNIEYLRLNYCENITDGSPIASLSKLRYVTLSLTGITDISFFSELENLEDVYMSQVVIKDFQPLAKSADSLQFLDIGAYTFSSEDYVTEANIAFLEDCVNLEQLYMSGLSITSIPDLTALTSLTTLYLSDNYLLADEVVTKLPASITSQDNWMESTGMYTQRERAGDTSNLNDGSAVKEVDENIEIELEGTFKDGTFLETSVLADEDMIAEYTDELERYVDNIELMWFFDISTYKLEYTSGRLQKNKSQPMNAAKVKITMPIDSNYQYYAFRQEDDGTFTQLQYTIEGDAIQFYSDHFSIFSIIASLIADSDEETDTLKDNGEGSNANNTEQSGECDSSEDMQSSDYTDDNEEKNDFMEDEDNDTANVNDENKSKNTIVNKLPSIIAILLVMVGILIYEVYKKRLEIKENNQIHNNE